MEFRRKLARLDDLAPIAVAEASLRGRKPAESTRGATLEELRRKMAAILERPLVAPRLPADPSATELPFACVQTEWGVLHQRCQALAPSYHVGRIPVDAALDARPEMLALLALNPAIADARLERVLFLDTETTGLGTAAGIIPFLIGLAWFDEDGRLTLEQFLLRSPADEGAMLRVLLQRLQRSSLLVSYNGKTFDWPLLVTRFVMNRLPEPAAPLHLDLLHVGRRLHRRRLGVCRLMNLESDVLGFARGPDIEGGEIAARYSHFLRTGDERALRAVVEHNLLDVLSMAALVGLYGEPLQTLHDEDLLGLGRTLKRAGALEHAAEAAERAVARGVGAQALRLRGELAKARGDRARALADFELSSAELDDPSVRLELAKLYEHHVKEPLKALAVVLRGTGEAAAAELRRRQRLERKIERSRL